MRTGRGRSPRGPCRSSRSRSLAIVAVLALTGCSVVRRAPKDLVSQLPYAGRVELLEAEHDLRLAKERLLGARREVAEADRASAEAGERARLAKEGKRSALPEDGELAALSLAEAAARQGLLELRRSLARAREALAQKAQLCAGHRYERAKLRIGRLFQISGADESAEEPLEAQARGCEAELEGMHPAYLQTQDEERRAEALWLSARDAFAARTPRPPAYLQ